MKTHARVVVIGGGVVGVGTLYHLAKKGWSDVVLVERRELTSGSTWHAAGLLPLFNMSYSVGQIHKYSVELYRTLEARDGAERGTPARRQHPTRDEPRPDGRVSPVRGGGPHHRGGCRVPDPRRDRGDLAAVQHRRPGRSDSASRRRLRAAGGPDPGARDWCAPRRCGAVPQHHGDLDLPDHCRRVVRAHRQGRHRLRARGQRDGELRPAHRRDGRAGRSRHSGAAPVHRHRAASGDSGPSRGGAARDGGAARVRRLVVPARGAGRPDPRTLRDWRPRVLRRRPRRGLRIRAVPGGPGTPGAAHRGCYQPGAGLRRGRGQAGLQRRHLLHPGREPDHRSLPGASTISGSTKATASALPRREERASSSRSGWWRASRPST